MRKTSREKGSSPSTGEASLSLPSTKQDQEDARQKERGWRTKEQQQEPRASCDIREPWLGSRDIMGWASPSRSRAGPEAVLAAWEETFLQDPTCPLPFQKREVGLCLVWGASSQDTAVYRHRLAALDGHSRQGREAGLPPATLSVSHNDSEPAGKSWPQQ